MISKPFFAQMSNNISIGKIRHESHDNSFGGISCIIAGNFFQFPSVACTPSVGLYWPLDPAYNSLPSQVGETIYDRFSMVVTFKQQIWVIDKEWFNFLHQLCYGEYRKEDSQLLQSLVLTLPDISIPDLIKDLWWDIDLVTPHHAVREQWNDASVMKHCQTSSQQLLILPINHKIKGLALSVIEECTIVQHYCKNRRQSSGDLQEQVKLALDLQVFITCNIDLDMDLSNGACNTIVDIILHEDESSFSVQDSTITLYYPSSIIFVKLDRTHISSLEGLNENVISIECYINHDSNNWYFHANLSLGVLPVQDGDLAYIGNVQKPNSLAALS